jgi:proteasome alpha subunit
MSMSFYVPAEQQIRDKADFARKGIARGRSLTAVVYADGLLICAENPSTTLHKVSEIYDRIAFAGVGRYNEFDQLRRAGVRSADLTGYSFSREDVNARSLATSYAQYMGQVFTHEIKPMEVEILVAEVADDPRDDQLYHILFDGTVMDEDNFSVLGGETEQIVSRLEEEWKPGLDLDGAIRLAVAALSGPDRTLTADDLEVAILDRHHPQRAFKRIVGDPLTSIVPAAEGPVAHPTEPKADLPPADDAPGEPESEVEPAASDDAEVEVEIEEIDPDEIDPDEIDPAAGSDE